MSELKIDIFDGIRPGFNTLRYFAQWKPNSNSKSIKFWYKIYSIVVNCGILVMYTLLQIINIILSRDDLEKITDASFLCLTHFSHCVKLSQFVYNQKQIQELIDTLKLPQLQPRNKHQANILRNSIFVARVISYTFLTMGIGTCVMWAVIPMVRKSDEKWELPLAAWFPFRTDRHGTYELAYIYQITAACLVAANNVSMDLIISGFMIMMAAQLDILNDTLANLRNFAMKRLEMSGRRLRFSDESQEKLPEVLEKEMHKIFVECVYHHWLILDFTKRLGSVFNVSVLNVFGIGVVIICMTMFKLTLVEPLSPPFFSTVLYQSCMVLEILLCCWYGNEIILKSSDICLSIYTSDWYRCSLKYKKNLLIMMIKSAVPVRIYAGNLFMLSLPTFAAIMKTSWSYLAVLRSVNEPK